MASYTLSLAGELVKSVEAALGLGLADTEFEAAQALVGDIVHEDEMPDLAAIVACIEKAAGLALDAQGYAVALAAARRFLAPYLAADLTVAPDTHLEMAYEDQVSGSYAD
ncbi:MAG: hypothetical protein IT318_08320 [Anaerolineales bacterium]|nr:hypothetical protein [Anaerolineales bacterium]